MQLSGQTGMNGVNAYQPILYVNRRDPGNVCWTTKKHMDVSMIIKILSFVIAECVQVVIPGNKIPNREWTQAWKHTTAMSGYYSTPTSAII